MNYKKMSALFITLVLSSGNVFAKGAEGHGDHKHLPPGLEKRQEQGKPLPPGWQKKLSKGDVLDNDIYARGKVVVPVGKNGTITIEVEGTILKLHEKTREILDIVYR